MAETRLLSDSLIGYPQSLALFSKPLQQVGIRNLKMIQHHPINSFDTQNVIKFDVKSAGLSYIDLSKTLLKLKVKILKGDNSKIPELEVFEDGYRFKRPEASPSPPKDTGEKNESAGENNEPPTASTPVIVAPENNFLHTILQRVDCWLQQTLMSDSDENYPYLAYFKALQAAPEQKKSTLQMQMYFENKGGSSWVSDFDPTLQKRAALFAGSREVTMVGKLASAVFDIGRLLPQNTGLQLALYPHKGPFCLLSPDLLPTPDFKVVITEAILEVATVEVRNFQFFRLLKRTPLI